MPLFSGTTARHGGLLALAVLVSFTPPAFAQGASRSYRALFGGASAGTDRDNAALLLTLGEASDQDVLGADAIHAPAVLQANKLFTQLSAEWTYRANGRNVQFASTAGANFRYYRDQDQLVGIGHNVGAGVSAKVSRTTSLVVNQTVAYSPSYLYRLFASVAPPEPGQATVGLNYALNENPSYSYGTDVAVTQQMGRRSRLLMAAAGHYTDYVGATSTAVGGVPLRDLTSYETGATFIRDTSRGGHLNVGYLLKRAQYFGVSATEHDVNIGFDYDRALSRTRKTHLKFSVGSIMLNTQAPALRGSLRQQFQFVGDMLLSRQFGRTWQAAGVYRRSVGFIEGFSSPVLTDGFTVTTTGLLSPRVDLRLTGAYSVGKPAIAASASKAFASYTGNVRTRVALNSRLAVYGEYLYYVYDFRRSILLPAGALPEMSRNGAHLGVTLYLPMGIR